MIKAEDILREQGEPVLARLTDLVVDGDESYIDTTRGGWLLTMDMPESWKQISRDRAEYACRQYAKMAKVPMDEDEIAEMVRAADERIPDEMHVGMPIVVNWN